MRITAVVVFAVLVAGAPVSHAQTPPGQPAPAQPAPGQPATPGQRTPPRAGPVRPGEPVPTGTAVLRGQVFSVDGTPLRRAQVRATGQDGRGGGVTSTDPRGGFEIKDLPAGRYSINASKAGYVSMSYGQRRAGQAGGSTILDVLDGQIVEKINFALPRGGVIAGRIVDEFGEPIAGVQVSTMRSQFFNGARRMMPTGPGDNTDDTGAYRIYGLAPGEYLVSGTFRAMPFMMPGMISQNEPEGYAPSYYPGTASMAEAQRVNVRGGQELTGVNFALAATKLARVRGRVTNSGGEGIGGLMIMVTNVDPNSMYQMMFMSRAQTRGDGTFEVTGLSQGTYSLTARSMGNPMNAEFAQARVTVGDDLDGVLMVMSRGATARGVVTTDEGTALPVRGDQIRIFAQPTDPNPDFGMGGMPPTVNDDHSFEMTGLVGQRLMRGSLAQPGTWFLKSVTWRDQDVTDTPIDFVPGQVVDGLQIVFTRKVSEITGSVKDDRGQPVLGAQVVVFPGDPSRWTFSSRYMRIASVDQQGRFSLKNMPPSDDYRLVAVQDLEPGRNSDPEFLEGVRDLASRVSLIEGGTAAQDLKVVKIP